MTVTHITPRTDDHTEKALLGALLQTPRDALEIADIVCEPDFYQPHHGAIFNAIFNRAITGQPYDQITIGDDLITNGERNPHLRAYLAELTNSCPTPALGITYAHTVREQAEHRRLATTLTTAHQHLDQGHPLDTIVEQLHNDLERTQRGRASTENSWEPVNLTALLAQEHLTGPEPTTLTRRDGTALLYPGAIHSISGEPGSGKTWVAILAAHQQITTGNNVLYIDFEDRAATLITRLRAIGTPDHAIANHIRYIRPEQALNPTARRTLDNAAQDATLAVIDGITEAMTLHGLSLMDNEDVARWLTLIPHHIANQGPAVLQIDHVVKNAEARGRYAIGGQHKLAGITGAAYKMITVKSFGKGNYGHAKLVIDKDRHGSIGPSGTTAAEFHFDARTDTPTAWLDASTDSTSEATGQLRPTHLMEKVSNYLEHVHDATGKQIEDVIKGKRDYVRLAVRTLIAEGYVVTQDGPRGSVLHRSIRPYEEASDAIE